MLLFHCFALGQPLLKSRKGVIFAWKRGSFGQYLIGRILLLLSDPFSQCFSIHFLIHFTWSVHKYLKAGLFMQMFNSRHLHVLRIPVSRKTSGDWHDRFLMYTHAHSVFWQLPSGFKINYKNPVWYKSINVNIPFLVWHSLFKISIHHTLSWGFVLPLWIIWWWRLISFQNK